MLRSGSSRHSWYTGSAKPQPLSRCTSMAAPTILKTSSLNSSSGIHSLPMLTIQSLLIRVNSRNSRIAMSLRDASTPIQREQKAPPVSASQDVDQDLPNKIASHRLPLAVLEAFARARLAVLLALSHAGIARKQALRLERRAKVGIHRKQRAGQAVADGAGLAGWPAPRDADASVVFVRRASDNQRLGEIGRAHV